jgi:formate dehydrogenase (coenzyme F420) beta subunit
MSGIVLEMRRIVKSLFDEGKISVLVGFTAGRGSAWSRPVFIRDAAGAETLVWDATCGNNLAVYLPGLAQGAARTRAKAAAASAGRARAGAPAPAPGRIGLIVKGCDMRAVTALIKERQAAREDLVIIGMPCRGTLDGRRLDAAEIRDGDSEVTVRMADGSERTFEREPLLREACRTCMFPEARNVDASVAGPSRAPVGAEVADRAVKEFAALPAAERWRRFQEEMSRCIRCYACRQACPMCYCKECFAETNNPAWVGATTEIQDVSVFHLGRILHQAGRCVECGACSNACPMGIRLDVFTKKIAADARELFGFTADFSTETLPPLCAFKDDDPQGFITEPDKG